MKLSFLKSKKEIEQANNNANSEIFAAIAAALNLYFDDKHDEESLILTMTLSERLISTWNLKIQYINN